MDSYFVVYMGISVTRKKFELDIPPNPFFPIWFFPYMYWDCSLLRPILIKVIKIPMEKEGSGKMLCFSLLLSVQNASIKS